MANRDIVVIGASAGGVTALKQLFALLPENLPAAIFVVIHLSPSSNRVLADILSRAGPLPVEWAENEAWFEHGRVYLAPPDMHLLLRDGRTYLSQGPRENLSRPAIDALFRSAAVAHDGRTIGVILSGALADGSVGLSAIERSGGLVLVQDPAEAEFPEMPENALAYVDADEVAPIAKLAEVLVQRICEPAGERRVLPDEVRRESEISFGVDHGMNEERQIGTRSVYSCPECQGALWEIKDGDMVRYRCHVGHAFSSEAMLEANGELFERALWSALRVLEERIRLIRDMVARAESGKRPRSAESYLKRLEEYEEQRDLIRSLLTSRSAAAPAKSEGAVTPLRKRKVRS